MTALVVVNAGLLILGLVLWSRRESLVDYLPPDASVGPNVYRILERARRQLFRGSTAVRFTIFVPSREDPRELAPLARLGWGRASRRSTVRLQKGEGLAGAAWQRPGSVVYAVLGSSPDLKTVREGHIRLFKLRPQTAAHLSDDQLRVRRLIAMSLTSIGGQFRGVLCIDSKDASLLPDGPLPADFFMALDQLGSRLAAALDQTPAARNPVVPRTEQLEALDDSRLWAVQAS